MSKLVIVESPTKAKTIRGYLPRGYKVEASMGHIRDLQKKVVTKLKGLLAEADELILATDEDREGESIGWHLHEVLKPKVPVKRMVFHEITKEAIQSALQDTREIDQSLVQAQASPECGRPSISTTRKRKTSISFWHLLGFESPAQQTSRSGRPPVRKRYRLVYVNRTGW